MGFKRENYTPKGICVCICLMVTANLHTLLGQIHCPVRVDFEPRITTQEKSANSLDEIKFPFFQLWNSLDATRFSDGMYATVQLPANKRSTVFKGKNLGLNIPSGARITGVEIFVEGRTEGDGIVEGLMMHLLDEDGNAVGNNKALSALPIDQDWVNSQDSTDFVWRYGAEDDTWGLLLTEAWVNNPNFGYALQVRNKLNAPVSVFVDHIEIVVHYVSLYEICSTNPCVPFYVDEEQDPAFTYEWYIPDGFELISDSEHDPAINIKASYAPFGTYEICVESFENDISQGTCCRAFNYANCEPSVISGQVFFDQNNNAANDPGDQPLADVSIQLYSGQGTLIFSTSSNAAGEFSFSGLSEGQYYIKAIDNIDSLVFALPNIGSDDMDSDITGAFGVGTSELINLSSGDTLTTIGVGYSLALTIGDFVWEDLNGDGSQQPDEPGISGVEVSLTDGNSVTQTTQTDTDGFYAFTGLTAGAFTLSFVTPDGYIVTIPNNAGSQTDSDITTQGTLNISFSQGGVVDTIDAGFFRTAAVGDFVWEDLNGNGLQDSDEPGIANVTLSLYDDNDELIMVTQTDSTGAYLFENVVPGDYFIEIELDTELFPTLLQAGGGASASLDSDAQVDEGRFVSTPFTVISNEEDLNLDFGFIQKPATIAGFTFLDENNNGQYDEDESFVSNISVRLFTITDQEIDETLSDEGGFYMFDEIIPGSYYVVFDLPEGYIFTTPDVGDDLSDSDVDNTFTLGSTALYTLAPEEENFTISAGYQLKPKVGDFVWLDENGNGIQDENEEGLNDILVKLFNAQNEIIDSVRTGPNPENGAAGYYLFDTLEVGSYYIQVPVNELYDFAIVEESFPGQNSTINNENGIGTSGSFSLIGNECNFNMDAGYAFKKGNIQGEVWVDNNEDGLQDTDDESFTDILIELYNEQGDLISFRNPNEEGEYSFNSLEAGNYYIVFTPSNRYRFTTAQVGGDVSIDSDVTEEVVMGSTTLLAVMDGFTLEDIDAGLIDGAIKISGQTWIDNNGNGIQEAEEDALSSVRVELLNLNDSLIATTLTDELGTYVFDTIIAGEYYILFTPSDESLINTAADQGGDDMTDDDVTDAFDNGSTDAINVQFFQDISSINAGYYQLSSIGDQVFIDSNENGTNDGEPGLDNVIVNLLDSDGTIIATDTTAQGGGLDSGYYRLDSIIPGTYRLEFIRPLFYQFIMPNQGGDDTLDSDVTGISDNVGITEEFTITSGNVNLTLDAGVIFQIPAESAISGVIWDDANANGLRAAGEQPIPMITLSLIDQNGQNIATTTSDAAGQYTFENLAEGFYEVIASDLQDRVSTFPNIGNDDTIDSDFEQTAGVLKTPSFFLGSFEDIDNVDLGLVNTLTIGDFVWEDSNNNGIQDQDELGIEEVSIIISNQFGVFAETLSDENGFYEFTNIPAGTYQICATLPSGFNFALSNVGSDLLDSDVDSTGCTDTFDFTAGGSIDDLDIGLTKNGSVEGIAFVDLNGNGVINLNDPGLDGIQVDLFTASGTLLETTVTTTVNDISGVFDFKDLKATDYYLVFTFPTEYIITNPDIGDDLTDSDITGTFGTGSTDLFAIPSGGMVNTVNGGAYLPASIGDEVWLDENADGIRDEGEDGVADIEVVIFRSFGVPFDTTTTDADGFYQFDSLKQGLYFIQFVIPQEFVISPADQGIDDDVDSDADETGKTPLISLAHGANLESVDCGIFSSMASLRSVVWNDLDGDGIRHDLEARIPGIKVSLHNDQGILVDSTETNALGLYAFQALAPGDYQVKVHLSDTEYAPTSMNMDADDYYDSDVNINGESEIFTSFQIEPALSVPNIDAGLYEAGGLVANIWEDLNADGIYDLNENPLEEVVTSLYSEDGLLVQEITSTSDVGEVEFDNLTPGRYYLQYEVDAIYVASLSDDEGYLDNNSDILLFENNYISPVFQVLSNQVTTHIDAGFYKGASLSSTVWFDENHNGIQDDQGDIPSGIFATIYDEEDKSVGTKVCNEDGKIDFVGIPKGRYYLKYYMLEDYQFTINAEDDELNSDVDHSNGTNTTKQFDFDPYAMYTHIDAGLISTQNNVESTPKAKVANVERGKNEVRKDDLKDEITFGVHPNPAINYLQVDWDEQQGNGLISIYNSQNQLVFQQNAKDTDRIQLTGLHPGIYYVKYQLQEQTIIKKILKIH